MKGRKGEIKAENEGQKKRQKKGPKKELLYTHSKQQIIHVSVFAVGNYSVLQQLINFPEISKFAELPAYVELRLRGRRVSCDFFDLSRVFSRQQKN